MTTLDKMLQGLANALGASLSTLTTTAKTVVGAINELKSGLTTTETAVSGHTSTIGSGALDTTSQTLIGAVNELNGRVPNSFQGIKVKLNTLTPYYIDQITEYTSEYYYALPFNCYISNSSSQYSGSLEIVDASNTRLEYVLLNAHGNYNACAFVAQGMKFKVNNNVLPMLDIVY